MRSTPGKAEAGATPAGLVLDGVEIRLEGRSLLALDRTVLPGETLTVMGPSGSGKSTLFAFLAGFLDPAFTARGRVLLDGRDLTGLSPQARRVGLMFQDALLFPHMSVGGNLLFAVPGRVKGRKLRHAAVEAMLSDVGLDGFFARDPATLSGGQAARVALARTLIAEPRALLLDEPFSPLDQALRAATRDLVFDRIEARNIPAILVTHDPADAKAARGAIVEIGGAQAELQATPAAAAAGSRAAR
ncbi:ATP-binding cassette domain-containing protein [Jiella sonneratiae]|uniref:ATP-binding cassette domain-containing protein n=1 Tax=Jiella sonneratiae TaxID=2816856 RepID=A0ABS3J858_9HYPH|nr:ATP-binding cassette domain-containing protein [Jiella sonneratiae]MBO0905849.1 ATP-binding cassette domain-containing protein [Jiella sonneratiae]